MSSPEKPRKAGRPLGSVQTTKRSHLRKVEKLFKKYVDEAVLKAAFIMEDNTAKPETQLRAAIYILDKYISLGGEILKHEEELNKSDAPEDDESENDEVKGETPRTATLSLIREKDKE